MHLPKPTPPQPQHPDRTAEQERQHAEDALDEALSESFPASDPVAIDIRRPVAGETP